METFSASLAFVRGIHRWPVNSPHKGQWRGALMFSLICARINGWVNNGKAGDLRRHRAHYDVIVMKSLSRIAKALGLISIRHRSDPNVLDRCLINIDRVSLLYGDRSTQFIPVAYGMVTFRRPYFERHFAEMNIFWIKNTPKCCKGSIKK